MKHIFFLLSVLIMANSGCKNVETNNKTTVNNKQMEMSEQEVETVPDAQNVQSPVTVDTTYKDLIIYFPHFDEIDLMVDKMPSKSDETVIMCAEAAFTGELKTEFTHFNIAGDHVNGGSFNKGYRCNRNTGAFIYDEKGWKFLYSTDTRNHTAPLKADGVKAGFVQEMLIHNGAIVKHTRADNNENEFRALCDFNGKLCIADGKGKQKFGDFIKAMHDAGIREALYLDMGYGWNHSWYRDVQGNVIDIHPYGHPYCTNWITFIKK